MKMPKSLLLASLLPLAGCAGTAASNFTHADLQNAAKIATTNGYPARAAVWNADDQLLTAAESQVTACKNAIAAAKPTAPSGTVGLATLTELGAETAAKGIPANVAANCAPLPLPLLPIIPKP